MRAMKVHPTAAENYALARGLSVAAGVAELLRLLDPATPKPHSEGRLKYRYRNRVDQLDVQAIVDTTGEEPIVIAVTVRDYRGGHRGGRYK